MTDAVSASPPRSIASADLLSVAACGLIWGTTWFAITQQLGAVPAVVSVAYRFTLAAALIFLWCGLTRRRVRGDEHRQSDATHA